MGKTMNIKKKDAAMKLLAIYFGIFLIVILNCLPPPKYSLISSEKLTSLKDSTGQIPPHRFILSPLNYNEIDSSLFSSQTSCKFLNLLETNRLKDASKLLHSNEFESKNDTIGAKICGALFDFFSGNYESCFKTINTFTLNQKSCFLTFLKTDCNYEINRFNASNEYLEFLPKYQEILDCSPHEIYQSLIKMRIKLIRYGY
jgi:hypothetical protein